jgi:hypothetical protein
MGQILTRGPGRLWAETSHRPAQARAGRRQLEQSGAKPDRANARGAAAEQGGWGLRRKTQLLQQQQKGLGGRHGWRRKGAQLWGANNDLSKRFFV